MLGTAHRHGTASCLCVLAITVLGLGVVMAVVSLSSLSWVTVMGTGTESYTDSSGVPKTGTMYISMYVAFCRNAGAICGDF